MGALDKFPQNICFNTDLIHCRPLYRSWFQHVYLKNFREIKSQQTCKTITRKWECQNQKKVEHKKIKSCLLTTPITEGNHPLYKARGPSSRKTVERAWKIPLYWLGDFSVYRDIEKKLNFQIKGNISIKHRIHLPQYI